VVWSKQNFISLVNKSNNKSSHSAQQLLSHYLDREVVGHWQVVVMLPQVDEKRAMGPLSALRYQKAITFRTIASPFKRHEKWSSYLINSDRIATDCTAIPRSLLVDSELPI